MVELPKSHSGTRSRASRCAVNNPPHCHLPVTEKGGGHSLPSSYLWFIPSRTFYVRIRHAGRDGENVYLVSESNGVGNMGYRNPGA